MKKYITCILLIFLMSSVCYGAGSVVVTAETMPNNTDIRTIKFAFTADAADGSFPDTALTADQLAYVLGFHFYQALTDPGITAPTANYDIAVIDEYNGDMAGGELADRSATATERVAPLVGSAYGGATVISQITIQTSNNSVNSAVFTLILMFSK